MLQTLLQETRYISRWIADVNFSLDSPPRIARADTTWIAPAAGAGWAAIGDAAAAFDPLSSHGMTTALWTAITAADAAAAALSGQTAPLARYADRVAAGVQDFLHSRSSIYSQETRFADQPFWQQRRIPYPAYSASGRRISACRMASFTSSAYFRTASPPKEGGEAYPLGVRKIPPTGQ
ncbi:MAG: hypothetical protein R3F53_16675 [Gammaproteobacteria bacterium]